MPVLVCGMTNTLTWWRATVKGPGTERDTFTFEHEGSDATALVEAERLQFEKLSKPKILSTSPRGDPAPRTPTTLNELGVKIIGIESIERPGPHKTILFLDHNVWDFLLLHNVDLLAEFPPERYSLAITSEGEFEIPLTPEPLQTFINAEIERCSIVTDFLFGWEDKRHEQSEQRVRGFGKGRWAAAQEVEFYASQGARLHEPKRKTRLYKNEADIALGARAFAGVVLSLDKKPGPLRDALNQGGQVLFLHDLAWTAVGLGAAAESRLAEMCEGPAAGVQVP